MYLSILHYRLLQAYESVKTIVKIHYFSTFFSHIVSFYRLIKLQSASQTLHSTSLFPTYNIPGPILDLLFLFVECNTILKYFVPSASPAFSSNAYTDHPAEDRKASI